MPSNRKKNLVWTKEKCHAEVLKFKTRTEFQRERGGAYNAARKNGWIDDICSHMTRLKKSRDFWTKEKCHQEALKCKTRTEFSKNSHGAYYVARKNGWLDEVCSHMTSTRKPKGYWTKERCHEEALKFKTRGEFQKKLNKAYYVARKKGWLDEICSHMTSSRKPKDYWTKERCHKESLKLKSRNEFYNNSGSAYNKALRNKWLDDICSHMISLKKPKNYWTKKRCYEEALKYKTKSEFRAKSSGAYKMARRKDWLDDIIAKAIVPNKRGVRWKKEECREEALEYSSKN